MHWKDTYPKSKKPAYSDLLAYLPENIQSLFLCFDSEMNERFGVYNKWQRYDKNAGWVYSYCRNYRFELLTVTIQDGCFNVLGGPVSDADSLIGAIKRAEEAYADGFEERYEALCAKRRTAQIERTKKRLECEKIQMDMLTEQVDSKKFNQFKWCKKVSRRDLLRLYQSEAKGMTDEALLDDVGFTFYTRCAQAKKARDLMQKGQMFCFQCGAVLQAKSYTGLAECTCGCCYTYREFRRSCNAADMPGGRAAPVFEDFVQKWPYCRDAVSKMMLIDRLIHECHVTLMSGIKGRSVCVNLIDGTKKQISDVIMQLAYGNNS